MINTTTERTVPKQGAMGTISDPRIIEPKSQATPVEELEPFAVDPKRPHKSIDGGKRVGLGGQAKPNKLPPLQLQYICRDEQ